MDLVRFGKSKLNIFTEKEYYEGKIDPNNGTDWNQTAPIDTKPTLDDFKKTVSDYLAWEVSNFVTTAIHKSSHNGQFDYGHNFYAKDADALYISLPVNEAGNPDYDKMAIIISAIHKLVNKILPFCSAEVKMVCSLRWHRKKRRQGFLPAAVALILCKSVQYLRSP